MTPSPTFPGAMALHKWAATIGKSDDTARRWIKSGMLKPTNIGGKHYVTADEDQRFWDRAKAGEFAAEIISVDERVKQKGKKV
jgi:predicted site-specific integrase-resolvase